MRTPKASLGRRRQAGDLSDVHETCAVGLRMAVDATAACQMRDPDPVYDHDARSLALLQRVEPARARTHLEDLATALQLWAAEAQPKAFLRRLKERALTAGAGAAR
ncbi:hypothetical protein [Streptomyces rubrogriseus]|uniref:Uncharacterized protein n=1 Tax=Streptomyces rubrogriseus TaxID=194673 RepID=A0A6G3TCW6_9ACTN|nr:hypothetical protein [Streptomyces rubrogriseus]NEC34540.1 hypothetical protein [Streptomyces rubrogriseus]